MRRFALVLASIVCVAAFAFAAERKHGKEITLKETTKIAAILASPDAFHEKAVLVEGTIVDVCKKRGCWIKIAEEGSAPILFKVTDGVMVFPVEARGSKVRAQGTVVVAKPEAEKGHEHEGTMCASCGKQTVMIKGEGAVVVDAEAPKAAPGEGKPLPEPHQLKAPPAKAQ